jgi:capsular polysaccharide biosynthesis protein
MESEDSLRTYGVVLVRRWKWVVAVTVVVLLIAVVITLLIPPTYEAIAIIISTPVPASVNPLGLMQSPAVAEQVLKNPVLAASGETPATLARKVRITMEGQDRFLYRVYAQAETSQKAAVLANVWAAAAIDQFNRTYITSSLQLKDRQAELAMDRLKQADSALANFAKNNALSINDVASFAAVWGLSTLRPINDATSPIPNISPTQITELAELLHRRDVAASLYASLGVQAAQLAVEVESLKQGAEMSKLAAEPVAPVQPNLRTNMGVGVILGVILGIVVAFTVEYVQAARKTHSATGSS